MGDTPRSTLGRALLPKSVHMTHEMNGAFLYDHCHLLVVNTRFPRQFLLHVNLQFHVIPHVVDS
jgi:hypothetical protein